MGLLNTLRELVGSTVNTKTEVFVMNSEDYHGLAVFFPEIAESIPDEAIPMSLKELGDALVFFDDDERNYVKSFIKDVELQDDGEVIIMTDQSLVLI